MPSGFCARLAGGIWMCPSWSSRTRPMSVCRRLRFSRARSASWKSRWRRIFFARHCPTRPSCTVWPTCAARPWMSSAARGTNWATGSRWNRSSSAPSAAYPSPFSPLSRGRAGGASGTRPCGGARIPACPPAPSSGLGVAERLGRIDQIGRLVRERVARSMTRAPAEYVFVNLHAHELLDSELYSASAPLSQFGKRIVIEISEHALLDDVSHLESRAEALRKLGFRLAMDNLGPGYPGLSSFARLRPEFVKYDLSLVHGIDRNPAQAAIVADMTALLGAMNTRVIAAGIESIAERDAVVKAGVDLLQGFAFSKPDTSYRQPDLG